MQTQNIYSDNDFLEFVTQPDWMSKLTRYARDLNNYINTLRSYFVASIEHQHCQFMCCFLMTVQDENFKRQLFFEQQAKNLLYALQTNNPDLINPIFDFLNQEKNSETSEVLVSTCDRWIQFIQKEALEVLFMELPLPALLNIYARLNTNHRHISRLSFPRTPHGEQLLKEILIQKLTQYIDSIDKGQRREFYYFKHRQTENRQINYELAKTLREKLATESTAEAFSNIYHLRHQIRLARTNAPWFNFINSRELNDIIALSHQAKFR